MTDLFSDQQTITMVQGLTLDRLFAFVDADLVIPIVGYAPNGPTRQFTRIDIARLRFICELADDLGFDEPTLGVVMALVDKLHAARNDLRSMARALDAESPDVRARIGLVLTRAAL